MRMKRFAVMTLLAAVGLGSLCGAAPPAPAPRAKQSVFEATLETQPQSTPELSTDEFKAFLAGRGGVVLDARPKLEFELSHIPGSTSIEETGLLRIVQTLPTPTTAIVIYSDGPFSDRTRLRAEELRSMGYANVSRYQLGLAVWQALGNTAETTLDGFRRIFHGNTAVFIDARSRAEYSAGTIPAAETVLAGEVGNARKDHRLQYYDHATRIVVFGNSALEARTVAEEIARNAYPNCSFFSGTYQELKRAKFFSERKPSPSNLDGLTR
ncbi:MAG TPA: rhodanese-like domain-containing protein [Ramlibacter sp.]|nr:rhodanese-like domain-containing protein [Ramlibacter sp.]